MNKSNPTRRQLIATGSRALVAVSCLSTLGGADTEVSAVFQRHRNLLRVCINDCHSDEEVNAQAERMNSALDRIMAIRPSSCNGLAWKVMAYCDFMEDYDARCLEDELRLNLGENAATLLGVPFRVT